MKHPLLQAVLFIVAAAVLAVVSNGFAARERRLALPGWYPNATKVPVRVTEPPPAAVTTAQQSPGPGQPAITITEPTATTATVPVTATVTATTTTAPTKEAPVKPSPVPTPAPAPNKPDASRFTPHPDKAYVEVSGDDVAALYAAGALFLDARRTSVFEEGHIAGARSFSVWEADVDDKVKALFDERSDPESQNKPIVIYCSGGACEDSHMLAQKLWGVQFNNVYVYKDGFPDWQQRGGAIRRGANP